MSGRKVGQTFTGKLSSATSFSCHSRLSQGSSVLSIISILLRRMKLRAVKFGAFCSFSLQRFQASRAVPSDRKPSQPK